MMMRMNDTIFVCLVVLSENAELHQLSKMTTTLSLVANIGKDGIRKSIQHSIEKPLPTESVWRSKLHAANTKLCARM